MDVYRLRCTACNSISELTEWGFVPLARSGWTADPRVSQPDDPDWLCPECSAARSPRPLRALLVDDSPSVLKTTARLLSGLSLVLAGSGDQALRTLVGNPSFDLIVSDVFMPGLGGPELMLQVALRFPQLAHKFLFLSGDALGAAPRVERAAHLAGVVPPPAILQKPVERARLLAEVRAVHERRVPRSGTYRLPSAPLPILRRMR